MNWTTTDHNKNKKYFENVIKNGVLSHAYLFSGPYGIGKKMFAYDIFRQINNREPEGDPDFRFLTPRLEEGDLPAGRHGTKIYVEDIRDLKAYLTLKPYYGPYKFVVIDDADRLVPAAANAFLKMLEEPAPFTVIILISSMPKLILSTVLSRCEKIQFLPSSEKVIDKKTAKAVDEFLKVCKEGVCERMQYAEKLFVGKDYQNLVVGLIHTLRATEILRAAKARPRNFSEKENPNHKVLKNLLKLNSLLSQPQFNHRLALENFLINL